MSMMLCAKCGEYYDPVQYCYECDPFENAKNEELARKDAEIARLQERLHDCDCCHDEARRFRAALERCRDWFMWRRPEGATPVEMAQLCADALGGNDEQRG